MGKYLPAFLFSNVTNFHAWHTMLLITFGQTFVRAKVELRCFINVLTELGLRKCLQFTRLVLLATIASECLSDSNSNLVLTQLLLASSVYTEANLHSGENRNFYLITKQLNINRGSWVQIWLRSSRFFKIHGRDYIWNSP